MRFKIFFSFWSTTIVSAERRVAFLLSCRPMKIPIPKIDDETGRGGSQVKKKKWQYVYDSTTACLICLHSQRTPCPCPALPKTFQDTRRQRDEPPSLLFLRGRGEIIIINIRRKKKKEKNSSSSWLFSLFPPSCSAFCIRCFFSFPAPSFRNKCQQVLVPTSQSLLSFFPLSGSFSFLLFLCFCLSPPSSSNFSFQDDHAKNGIRKCSSRVG